MKNIVSTTKILFIIFCLFIIFWLSTRTFFNILKLLFTNAQAFGDLFLFFLPLVNANSIYFESNYYKTRKSK